MDITDEHMRYSIYSEFRNMPPLRLCTKCGLICPTNDYELVIIPAYKNLVVLPNVSLTRLYLGICSVNFG